MQQVRRLLAITLAAFLAVAAIAAAGPRHPTKPRAPRLCHQVATGHTPSRLAASTAQVTAACARLQTSVSAAQTAYATATAPLRRQAFTVIGQYVQICHQDRLNHDAAACRPARDAAVATLNGLRVKARMAARAYRTAVNSARLTFWATIRALPGGSSGTADSAVVAAPGSPIPPNSAIPTA